MMRELNRLDRAARLAIAATLVLPIVIGWATEAARAGAEPESDITSAIDIDAATRTLFPPNSYLAETATPNKPRRCDDLKDRVYWVDINDRARSYLRQQEISAANFVAGFLSFGLTAFYGKDPPQWTIFSARTDGRYVTLLLGQPRSYDDADILGPQTRLTYYMIDAQGKRLGLVESMPIDSPPFARPQKGAPRYKTIHLRCIYRSDESNDP